MTEPAPNPRSHPGLETAAATRDTQPIDRRVVRGAALPAAQVFAALVVVGLALRPQVLVIGPLVGDIKADLDMSHAVAGLLGSIPVVCMGFLAPLGPVLAGSIGPRLGAALCVLLVIGFGLLRSIAPDAPTALLTTIGIGIGMAVVGPILAMAVRLRTPGHPAAGTGAYVVGMVTGATITAGVAVPLSESLGGWRGAMAIISAAGLVSLLGWLWLMPSDEARTRRTRPRLPRLPWQRRSAWLLGIIFGTQSILFYGAITWLPSLLIERGWSPADAAAHVALFTGIQLVSTLAVPAFADRIGTRRSQLATAGAITLGGAVLIAATRSEASGSLIPVLGTGLLGLGVGFYFPLSLTLPVDAAANPEETASISAMMLLVGYLIAAGAPVVFGLIRDATGGFDGVALAFVVVAAAMVPLPLGLNTGRISASAQAQPVA